MSSKQFPLALGFIGLLVCRYGPLSVGLTLLAIAAISGLALSLAPTREKPPPAPGKGKKQPRRKSQRALPPTAAFSILSTGARSFPARVRFDASASTTPSGTIVRYHWDFGDGTRRTSEERPVTTHAYAGPGTYTVRLTVENDAGQSAEVSEDLEVGDVLQPPTGVWASPGPGSLEVGWREVPNATTYNLYWAAEPGIAQRGGHREEDVESPYTLEGLTPGVRHYLVVCAVDEHGESATSEEVSAVPFSESQPPLATFTARPKTGTAPLEVTFDAKRSRTPGGSIVAYLWEFGDGQQVDSKTDPQVLHTYTEPGTYDARLTVVDSEGMRDSSRTTVRVREAVTPPPPEPPRPPEPAEEPTPPLPVPPVAREPVTPPGPKGPPEPPPPPVKPPEPPVTPPTGETPPAPPVTPPAPPEPPPPPPRPPAVAIPDPATVAPRLDGSVATRFGPATRFLYSGDNPVQLQVEKDAIDERRVAVVRGRVLDRDGAPLPEVRVRILGQPRLGFTHTRPDGFFDLAVNGGAQLTLIYERDGFLPSHRPVHVPWQELAWLDDVVLLHLDGATTAIQLGSSTPPRIARGAEVTDASGKRQSTLLFASGTQAEMLLPDGSTRPLTSLSVRATEFTVGASGPRAMPAPLPPGTGYTYAVELSADEALAAGASGLRFSQPVINYVDNFLGFPAGTPVPVGYYDRERGAWVPEEDGRVIHITGIRQEFAELDVTGTGTPSGDDALSALGITEAERRELARLYAPGTELWRVRLHHFSPFDYNWPIRPPKDARPPGQPPPKKDRQRDKPCERSGSIIDVHNQVLGEELPLPGTPFSLCYRSDRVPGHTAKRTLEISLSGPSVPPSLLRIDLEITGPRERVVQSFPPAPNQRFTYVWDGKDVYLRAFQGEARVQVTLRHVYPAQYDMPASTARSFGKSLPVPLSSNGLRAESTLEQSWTETLRVADTRPVGLGGWTLDVHHAYDPVSHLLHLGTGELRDGRDINETRVVAGGGESEDSSGDGGPAQKAKLYEPTIAVAGDGSVWIADGRVRQVIAGGTLRTVAGGGKIQPLEADGRSALEVSLHAKALALGVDGGCFVLHESTVLHVDRQGVIRRHAGGGAPADGLGDGGPATGARLVAPMTLATGPDGRLWVLDLEESHPLDLERWGGRIRVVDHDGTIHTVVGGGRSAELLAEGQPAKDVVLHQTRALVVGSDGSVYLAEAQRIRRVGPDGIIRTHAGVAEFNEGIGDWSSDVPATQAQMRPCSLLLGRDGRMFMTDCDQHILRAIGTDGIIRYVPPVEAEGEGPISMRKSGLWPARDGGVFFSEMAGNDFRTLRLWKLGPELELERQLATFKPEKSYQRVGLVAVTPDGVVYVTVYEPDEEASTLLRLNSGGAPTLIAGPGAPGEAGATLRFLGGLTADPDGSVYFCDGKRLWRVGPDGKPSIVPGADGSGVVFGPSSVIGVAADGSLYVCQEVENEDSWRLHRVSPSGEVTWMGGGGKPTSVSGDGIPALDFHFRDPRHLALSPSGQVLFLDGNRVRTVDEQGRIATVVGSARRRTEEPPGADDAILAKDATFELSTFTVARDGRLYLVVDRGVRRLDDDGRIRPIPGSELGSDAGYYRSIAVGPDGNLYGAIGPRVVQVGQRFPGVSLADELAFCDERGEQLFIFDHAGRHLRTRSTLTGQLLHTFAYDKEGRLAGIAEGDGPGLWTRLERDEAGNLTALVSPGGARTPLPLNGDGYLAAITTPSGTNIRLEYGPGGLLSRMTDPMGNAHLYTYDARGRLTRDEDPDGRFTALSREEGPKGPEVVVTQASGRQTRYPLHEEEAPSGAATAPAATLLLMSGNGEEVSRALSYPDGTSMARVDQPDPRFGPQFPILRQALICSPGGLQTTLGQTRTVRLADPTRPLELEVLTETMEVNGARQLTEIDIRKREVVHTSAAGRRTKLLLDDSGRALRVEVDGLEPVLQAYDAEGRLSRVSQGSQSVTFRFDEAGRPLSIVDAAGESPRCEYDAHGRLLRMVDGESSYEQTLDANGRLVAMVLPGGARHAFTYSRAGLPEQYITPTGGVRRTAYDGDGSIARLTLPSGRTIDHATDAEGQPSRITCEEAVIDIGYGMPGTGVSSLRRTPAGGGTIETLELSADGSLVTGMTVSGTINARYLYRYDANHRLAATTLQGQPEIAFEYDPDGLLTRMGRFSLRRDGPAGACSQLSDGTLTIELEHDRCERLVRRQHSVGGRVFYALELEYGPTGLLSQRKETTAGRTRLHTYAYDKHGQLTEVRLDGQRLEAYAYDARGNRTSRHVEGQETTARYALDDALLELSNTPVEVDADGFLQRRGDVRLRYGTQGELLEANAGSTVKYQWDPTGRLIGRIDETGTWRYFYGNLHRPFELSALQAPTGELTTFHYNEAGQLLALQRKEGWYYVATDQVGTPRVVCDANGKEVKVLEHDTFGRLREDSNPAFPLPIGFAGGLYDPTTGLTRFGARDYDAETGRWTAKDPLLFAGGDLNLYRYAMNNPAGFTDPGGTTVFSFFGGENMPILFRWIFEQGLGVERYGPDSPRTQDMRRSFAAHKMRELYRSSGCKSTKPGEQLGSWSDPFPNATVAAAYETVYGGYNPTQAQVGAFTYTVQNNGNGTVTFTLYNKLTINSFFYHIWDLENWWRKKTGMKPYNPNRKRGSEKEFAGTHLMGDQLQIYQWTEPNPCGCKKK